ncbi:MAG: hypothetical protein JJ992_25370 [Planctomycetes bacterium]|nr:hypothetical protein [Planctomycetota bacterium]
MMKFSPEFCERSCPICVRARRGIRWAWWLQRLERIATLGGCPWGRARQRKYGVPPHQEIPADLKT